jgi:preprotein translocase subunit YajC
VTTALYAILQAPASGATGGLPILLFQVVAIGLVFWFLILRPQGQARKKQAELLSALKKGDEVMTVGGIVGTVKDMKEMKTGGEIRVTIETGSSTVIVERSRIIRVGNDSAPGATGPV